MFEDDPVKEENLFADEPKFIADMLREDWSLGDKKRPNITFKPESTWVDSRLGAIYVYMLDRYNSISSMDYRTLERRTALAIKLSARDRGVFYEFAEEIYRILMANRRLGKRALHGNTFLEVESERFLNDLSGFYTVTFNIRLTTFNKPIKSAGFGATIDKEMME